MFLSELREFPSAPCVCSVYYSDADKSLVRPGRKQDNVSAEWREFPSAPCFAGKKKVDSLRLDVVEIARLS